MHLVMLSVILGLLINVLYPVTLKAETCVEWAAKVASAQGSVEVRRAGETPWTQVQRHDTFCPGDVIRVRERSRLAIVAQNGSNHRLDENTTITITQSEQKQTFLLNLRAGAAYFFSRLPRSLKVITPFANAGVEGTEFFVKVERDQTFLSVFEGRVAATNPAGSLTLASGQSAIVKAGQAPALHVVVRPRDTVQWALHYPPIIDFRPADFPGEAAWQAMIRQSILFYQKGDLPSAFTSIEAAPTDVRDARFFTYRAALLLTVGRVETARVDIESALTLDPRNSHALALQSIIAVVQNRKDEALQLATKAVELEPTSAAARVALSYAQQARFDLQGALASLKAAVILPRENALAWARLAELWLSVGNLKRALNAARRASDLNSQVARTQTVLGFAFLTQIKIRNAKNMFERAIQLDQTDPLSRLGLGLAQIRQGKLKEGRAEIEIAASLDPNNSIIRSYLGKAYFEEKRDKLARNQFATAKTLDPQDPTPWFYDAIRKQTVNRPVEALRDLQKSIELNDNRAVYRSRLLLDEDLGGRSARLGSLFRDLGFEQLALVEGWKSVNLNPSNHSAHRLLADTYTLLPRHEIARDSELLQSQLLQPINMNPVQPRLAGSGLGLAGSGLAFLDDTGPGAVGFNEFSRLFAANGLRLQADGIVGSQNTFADNVILSGIYDKVSYSIGQFHFETDGFRKNNDLKHDIYHAFLQLDVSPSTSVQAEFRKSKENQGDRAEFFDPNYYFRNRRVDTEIYSVRLGVRQNLTPSSILLGSYSFGDFDEEVDREAGMGLKAFGRDERHFIELRYLQDWNRINLTAGIGYFDSNFTIRLTPSPSEKLDTRHSNAYVYSSVNYPENVNIILGISGDSFNRPMNDRNQINPKLGIIWNVFPRTTLRAAAFKVLKRSFTSSQTLEPTQVAGFNQFFDDIDGTDSWRYGIAMDQTFDLYRDKTGPELYTGFELSQRELNVPIGSPTLFFDYEEQFARLYLYWTPLDWLVIRTDYQFEQFEHDPEASSNLALAKSETHRLPLEFRFFLPSGFFARTRATYINQRGRFTEGATEAVVPGSDAFWTVDALLGYRFPKRFGLVTLEVRNIFNEHFQFQDTDPENSTISRERVALMRLTLSF